MELTAPESPVVATSPRTRQLGLFEEGEGLTPTPTPAMATTSLAGELAFASPEEQLQRRAELLGAGALVVVVPPLPDDRRGHLAEHVDARIERELAARGAPSPYLASWSALPDDVEARLADQLFRARSVGACGIALLLGSIVPQDDATLTPADSATVRFFARCTSDRPVVMLVDDADRRARGYEPPVPITRWIAETAGARTDDEAVTAGLPPVSMAPIVMVDAEISGEALASDDLLEEEEPEALGDPPAPEEDVRTEALHEDDLVDDTDEEILGEVVEEDPVEPIASPPHEIVPSARVTATAPEARATAGVPVASASDVWRAWALALSATRGPQPLAAFEKLFAESYMPLSVAIANGLDDPRALRAHDEFSRAFERAYLDASATFGVTTRRPRMVMDAFDLAMKQARATNARTAQVLLVDSLRQDVGVFARDTLMRAGAGRVSLTSESLLWSAMPTTTVRQLETLARGVDALRAPSQGDPPTESLRGRTAEHARRLRVGSRELWKLDVVPSLLAQAQTTRQMAFAEDVTSVLPAIGEAVGEAILRHVASLPPRTLLYVVGDHGFTIDRRGRLSHGGASPEEVLVPAQAWLVGDLH